MRMFKYAYLVYDIVWRNKVCSNGSGTNKADIIYSNRRYGMRGLLRLINSWYNRSPYNNWATRLKFTRFTVGEKGNPSWASIG